jgi:uncharacterized protein (DUF2461 family)
MDNKQALQNKNMLKGSHDQEILMTMLTSMIEDVIKNPRGSIRVFTTQALIDSLEKRNTVFSKVMNNSTDERNKFIKEVVINTIKRAKLVEFADKIMPECDKVYWKWDKQYHTAAE